MNDLIFMVGCIGVFFIALLAGYCIVEFLWAIACSVSFHRWRYALAKKDGRKLRWLWLPHSFVVVTFQMLGHRNGGAVWSSAGGAIWNGIGDWGTGFQGKKND